MLIVSSGNTTEYIATSNSTSPSNSSSADYRLYLYTHLATGISLMILSPITIISNGLLLLTILKDPLKCFRTPATYFIVALALVDLTTGLFVETFFIIFRVASNMQWSPSPSKPYSNLYQIGISFSTVGINMSFLLVLGLILTQFLAITYPHHYKSAVTTRRVLACAGFSLVYFTGFILLQFVGVSIFTLWKVDLHLHATPITILLITGSAMLLRSYRQYAKASRRFESARSFENRDASSRRQTNRISERQFTIVILLLSGILIVCGLPHIIVLHIKFYTKQKTRQEDLNLFASSTIADEMMFVKVALDAFIYAWRLEKYRRSVRLVLKGLPCQVKTEASEMINMNNFPLQQQNP